MFVSLRGWRQKDPESVSQAYLVSSDKERGGDHIAKHKGMDGN